MSALRLVDLRAIFKNYESSKILVWEIVRTVHPVQMMSLLYILEHVVRDNKSDPVEITAYNDDEIPIKRRKMTSPLPPSSETTTPSTTDGPLRRKTCTIVNSSSIFMIGQPAHGVILCDLQPSLRLQSFERDYRILPVLNRAMEIMTNTANGRLTVYGLLKMMSQSQSLDEIIDTNSLTLDEFEVLNNIRTKQYTQFANNLLYHLLPDSSHVERCNYTPPNSKFGEMDLSSKFHTYYQSFERATLTAPREARLFYTTNQLHCATIYERPADLDSVYYLQPRYSGYYVIVNTTGRVNKVYNRHCEYIQALLIEEEFSKHSTFVAVLLPKSREPTPVPKSWRYSGLKTDRVHRKNYYFIVIVDVLRFRDTLLIDRPFKERQKYITMIKGVNVIHAATIAPNGLDVSDAWSRHQHQHAEASSQLYHIDGVVLRHKNSTAVKPPNQFRFSKSLLHIIDTQANVRLYGDCSVISRLDVHFSPTMAERCTICLIYGHDEHYYYCCKFDRRAFTFVHDVKLERTCDLHRQSVRYRNDRIVVQNHQVLPRGIALVRVYHNCNKSLTNPLVDSTRAILGYEFKFTTSMYDLPFLYETWFQGSQIL